VGEDPHYAPAWARLGRCYRVNAKFGGDQEDFNRAETALGRALVLNADLALAHNQLAYLEADSGRAEQAMVRLLLRAKATRTDPQLFAGLVHVCRFCGLLGASAAAHQLACRLDPGVRTSVCHTYFMRGDYLLAMEASHEVRAFLGPLALALLGREQDALRLAREDYATELPLANCCFLSVRLLLEGDRAAAVEMCERAIGLITYGPEELFYLARHLAYLGEIERAVAILHRAVEGGFFCHQALAGDAWLRPLRGAPGFAAILERALQRHSKAVRAFVDAGGERILGPLQ
jgi:tetratricopeptide (TPR) repeat protein